MQKVGTQVWGMFENQLTAESRVLAALFAVLPLVRLGFAPRAFLVDE